MQKPFQPFMKLLQDHLDFNLARTKCLLMLLESMIINRTVNLAVLSGSVGGRAKMDSHYMRFRRFMRLISFDYTVLARLLSAIMGLHNLPKWTLILDRTNWKFGKIHINILYLAVAHKSLAIPLFSAF